MKYLDILILTETKLDETILISQFLVDGFSKPYRFDKNKHGGEVMAYLWNTISSKILEKHSCPNVCGTYHPPSQNDEHYVNYIDKSLDIYSN